MEIESSPIWGSSILKILLAGIFLILLNVLARRYGSAIAARFRQRKLYPRITPLAGAVVWLIYFFWGANLLLTDAYYHQITVSIVIGVIAVWIALFVFRDGIAGLILRTQNAWKPGQQIRVGKEQGMIRSIGFLSLEIECKDSTLLSIPYSRIIGGIHGRIRPDSTTGRHRFEVRMSSKQPVGEAQDQLRTAILNTPWTARQSEPQIRLLEELPESYLFEALVTTQSGKFTRFLEDHVKATLAVTSHIKHAVVDPD